MIANNDIRARFVCIINIQHVWMRNNVQIYHPLVKTLRTRICFTASLGHNTITKKFTVIQLV